MPMLARKAMSACTFHPWLWPALIGAGICLLVQCATAFVWLMLATFSTRRFVARYNRSRIVRPDPPPTAAGSG